MNSKTGLPSFFSLIEEDHPVQPARETTGLPSFFDLSLPTGEEEEEEEQHDTAIRAQGKRERDPPPPPQPSRAAVKKKRAKKAELPSMIGTVIPMDLADTLSSFDKDKRSDASPGSRVQNLGVRLKRKLEKADKDGYPDPAQLSVDDSLLRDDVSSSVRMYERHSQYKGSSRIFLTDTKGQEEDDEDEEDEEEEEEQECVFDEPIYNDNDDGEDAVVHMRGREQMSVLLLPTESVPDIQKAQTIAISREEVAPNPAMKQFMATSRQIRGKEKDMFVPVDSSADRYQSVSEKLSGPMTNEAFMAFSIEHGIAIPKLPPMSREEIKDARASIDQEAGERACGYGRECASYQLSLQRKDEDPERYAGLPPWPCKEFYFGPAGDRIRTAIVSGVLPEQVQNPTALMCVMCHEKICTDEHDAFKMGVSDKKLHVLQSYQIMTNVPGEYPGNQDLMLMGDGMFCGIVKPFLRWNPDNYEWIPDRTPGAVQRWTEKPCLDFQ